MEHMALAECMENESAWATADLLVSDGPCMLISGHITPDGSNTCTVNFRDGQRDDAELKCTVITGATNTRPLNLACPLFFMRGMFLELPANVGGVFVQYRRLTDREVRDAVAAPKP